MMASETLTIYSNPPNNILGATLFLSYILLALYFSLTTILTISHLYTSNKSSITPQNVQRIRILSILSFLSFATLSYHMLKFLLLSYFQWRISESFFRGGTQDLGFLESLKDWMLENTLFQDFATELVGDAPSRVWTQIALLGTWFWGLWSAQKARERGLGARRMVPYIALGQILPISFSSGLVLLRLLVEPAQGGKNRKSPDASTAQRAIVTIPLSVATVAFNGLLLVFASLPESTYLIPFVLLTRFYLLLPHLGITGVKAQGELATAGAISLAFVVVNVGLALQDKSVGNVIDGIWNGGEALKALGWDAIWGAIIAGTVSIGGRV